MVNLVDDSVDESIIWPCLTQFGSTELVWNNETTELPMNVGVELFIRKHLLTFAQSLWSGQVMSG